MELISALSVETILEFQVLRRSINVKTTSKARDNAVLSVRLELEAGNFERWLSPAPIAAASCLTP